MATFPSVLRLSSLNGTNGFRINGETDFQLTGYSVASAGDVNGDGFDDVLIADRGAVHPETTQKSYVVFGKAGGFPINVNLISLDGANGFKITGKPEGDTFGQAVSRAGDVNGDGFGDFIIGFHKTDLDSVRSDGGASYVVFGSGDPFGAKINLSGLDGTNGFQISGETGRDYSGYSVASAGDVNGDGFDDLIIGAPRASSFGAGAPEAGASYVVFGKAGGFTANLDLSDLTGANGFQINGAEPFSRSGTSVSSAGDVDGNGIDDLLIASELANGRSGATYVVFGSRRSFPAEFNLSSLDGANGFKITGEAANDYSGSSVSSAGDVNGDGFGDFIIGAKRKNANGDISGASYVVFGSGDLFVPEINLSFLNGNGFRISGEEAGDATGCSVASAGDVNGDGFDDVIIGAFGVDSGSKTDVGVSYVVFGKAGEFKANLKPSQLTGTNGFKIIGEAASDISGYSVSSAGDVNGDGFGDLLIGAPGADPSGTSLNHTGEGSGYVVFGREPDTAVTRIGAAGDQTILGGAFNDTLDGRGGDDRLEGRAGNDSLLGGVGRGKDALAGGSGNDQLTGGRGDDILDGGAQKDRLTSGAGLDTFVFTPSAGKDRVLDFADGKDLIDVLAFRFDNFFDDISRIRSGDDLIVELSDSGVSFTLVNFLVKNIRSDLTAEDFVL